MKLVREIAVHNFGRESLVASRRPSRLGWSLALPGKRKSVETE